MREIENRISSVDIGRGFAILCMITAHIPVTFWMLNEYGRMFAPPFFLLISGVSFEIFINSRIQKNISYQSIFLKSFSRSVFIYLLPLIPYIAACLLFPEKFSFQLIHWGVFQVIAIGYIHGFLVHHTWKLKALSICAVFFITTVIRTYFHNSFGFLLSDFTPVLPWIAYFIMGQLICEVYNKESFTSSKLSIIALIAFIFSIVFPIFPIFPSTSTPAFMFLRFYYYQAYFS